MTKVTEELVAQFIQLHRGGDSFRAIGAKFGVDPRTVKSGIEKGEKQRNRDHWEAVSRQVDLGYLEEHLGMLNPKISYHATPTYMGVFARACLDLRRQDGRALPLALWPKNSTPGRLRKPADDLFGGYHFVGHIPEVDQRRLVAVS